MIITHFGELVEEFSDRPGDNIHGFMREIDEGFDSLLQSFVCFDLADINAGMGGELEQRMNINRQNNVVRSHSPCFSTD